MLYTLQFAFHSTNFAYWLHHIFYFSMNGTAYSTLQLAPTQSALLNTLYLMLYTLHFAFHWIALHLHLLNTHQYNGRNAVKDESVQRAPQDSVSSFATICIPTKMENNYNCNWTPTYFILYLDSATSFPGAILGNNKVHRSPFCDVEMAHFSFLRPWKLT